MTFLVIQSGPAAAFAGMLLHRLGRDVTCVEQLPPLREAEPMDRDTRLYLDAGQRSLPLDLRSANGRGHLLELAKEADAIVEDLGPGALESVGLSSSGLRERHPDLSLIRISAFGSRGPRTHWQSSELVVQAMGGTVHGTGFNDREPYCLPGTPAHFIAGIHAATAALTVVMGVRTGTPAPPEIEVSVEEAYVHHWTRHNAQWAYSGTGMVREEPWPGPGRQGFPHTARSGDGWIYLLALWASWDEVALVLGLDEFVGDEWASPATRLQRWNELDPAFERAVAERSSYDWFMAGAEAGFTFAPIHEMLDLLASPQLEARKAMVPRLDVGGQPLVPDLPYGGRVKIPQNRGSRAADDEVATP